MNKLSYFFVLFLGLTLPNMGWTKPFLFACEPEWGALAKELVGEHVEIYVATTAAQDPHHVEARPSLLAAARRADMLICTGAELETGWLPILLRESGNDKIQPGSSGHFMAADYVEKLDIPEKLDRAEGDVHAEGNPHVHLDPRNISLIARALGAALRDTFPELKATVSDQEKFFQQRWSDAVVRWDNKAQPLNGLPIVVQHVNTRYLAEWLKLNVTAALEPKPGIPPNAGHLAKLLDLQRQTPAKLVMLASYEDAKPSRWLSENAHIPAVAVPFTVGATGADDLFSLFDTTIELLLKAAKS